MIGHACYHKCQQTTFLLQAASPDSSELVKKCASFSISDAVFSKPAVTFFFIFIILNLNSFFRKPWKNIGKKPWSA